jgi:hypothetical protein
MLYSQLVFDTAKTSFLNSPLHGYRLELGCVFGACLNPQTGSKNKLSNRCSEAREECIERLKYLLA